MKKKKYTLVEMLVVIGVMALLLTVAAPAFNRIANGTALSIANRELGAQINFCRNYAVTRRCYVALVFPSFDDSGYSIPGDATKKQTVAEYLNRSYRACVISYDPDANSNNYYRFHSWIEGESWSHLPTGVVFGTNSDSSSTSSTDYDFATKNDWFLTSLSSDNKLGIPYGDGTQMDIEKIKRMIVFKPNGQLITCGGANVKIRVTEGFVDDVGEGKIIIRNKIADNETVYSVVNVNKYTGRVTYGAETAGFSE